MNIVRCLIIGSGPAGYTAAIYAARSGLAPVVIEGLQPGGQLTTTTVVENFPGFPDGIDASELLDNMKLQAQHFGAEFRPAIVVEANLTKQPYVFKLDDGSEIQSNVVIIATGATAKYLGLADEKKYQGEGVSACATCDGFFYRKKTVAVVGGGDTACEEALYLAGLASKVYMVVRKPYLRASEVMQKRVFENEKIEILFETNVTGLFGNNGVEGAHLVHKKGTENESVRDIAIDGFFLAIGHCPNTDVFKPTLPLDGQGYILTTPGTPCTALPGVFAAGDVMNPHFRQAVIAAGTGSMAAIAAKAYIDECGL